MTLYVEQKPSGLEFLNYLSQEDLTKNFEDIFNSIDQQTAKLLDVLIVKQTESGFSSQTTTLDIKEYATILNGGEKPTRSQINKAREKIKKGIEALKYIKYTYQKGKRQQLNISLYGGTDAIGNGKAIFKFNEDFFKLNFKLANGSYLAFLPIKLLSLNEKRFPHAYLLAKKIWSLRRINRGNKQRETNIKVKTLYEYALTLPRYNKTTKRRAEIIEPFERDLNAIENTGLLKWHYDTKYIEKTESRKSVTFEDWLNATIVVEWSNEYNLLDASIIEGKAEHNKKVAKKKCRTNK